MAWSGSTRRAQLPPDWDRRSQRVKERDQGRCQRCRKKCAEKHAGRWRGGEVDHKRRGDDHTLSNLQLLCTPCHARKTAAEGVEARKRSSPKRTLPAHPSKGGG